MKRLFTLFAFFSFLLAQAQFKKGVVYFNNGNNQEGLIKTRALGGIKFKQNQESEIKSYDYNHIKGYDITEHGSVKFRYKKVGDFYKVMKVIRLGKVNLYSVFVSNEVKNQSFAKPNSVITGLPVSSGNVYYIEKSGITIRIGSKIKKKEYYLFEDCQILIEKIKQKEFKKDDIYKIVNFYNMNCK